MSLKAKIEDFREAHTLYFQTALSEIEQGCKQGHWMWFIFPQIYGLGKSCTANRYAICSLQEANAFLGDEVLGSNLRRICEALLKLKGLGAKQIFGGIDAMKLQSSLTLFDAVQPNSIFGEVLDKYYGGERDSMTLCRLGLDDRMLKALEFIGVDAKDFNIVPQMYDFQRTEPTHRFSHTYRVMIGAALIAHKIKESRLGLLAFIAAFTHDLARKNDWDDPQHGRRAAQTKLPKLTHLLSKYKVTPQEYEMIAKAVTYHCEVISGKLSDDCFKVCKMNDRCLECSI